MSPDDREAERMRLFREVYVLAFTSRGENRYTEASYARTALSEFDKAFPSAVNNPHQPSTPR
jgi:hypothetical protein